MKTAFLLVCIGISLGNSILEDNINHSEDISDDNTVLVDPEVFLDARESTEEIIEVEYPEEVASQVHPYATPSRSGRFGKFGIFNKQKQHYDEGPIIIVNHIPPPTPAPVTMTTVITETTEETVIARDINISIADPSHQWRPTNAAIVQPSFSPTIIDTSFRQQPQYFRQQPQYFYQQQPQRRYLQPQPQPQPQRYLQQQQQPQNYYQQQQVYSQPQSFYNQLSPSMFSYARIMNPFRNYQ